MIVKISVVKWNKDGRGFVEELERQLEEAPDALLFELTLGVHSRPPSAQTIGTVVGLLKHSSIPTALVVDAPRYLRPVILPVVEAIHGAVVKTPMQRFNTHQDAISYFRTAKAA